MWKILTLLIAVIAIWFVGSKMDFSHRPTNSSIIKQETVQKIQNDADQHLEEARQLEREVKERLHRK